MTLDEFKGIFWWEYFHRLLGRADRRRVPRCRCSGSRAAPTSTARYAWKLAGIFVLGGLQGAMGWYMVKSGLVDDPRVSQFRLTAHLGLALADLRRDVLGRRSSSLHPRRATLTSRAAAARRGAGAIGSPRWSS